jgi:putative transposase
MKFSFIAREKATFPIDLLCTVLGVSRAGFYAAHHRPVAAGGARISSSRCTWPRRMLRVGGAMGVRASIGNSRRRGMTSGGIA